MKITKTSAFTGADHTREIPCTEEQLKKWRDGACIQDAMPNVSPEDREFLMTGITPEEWNDTFSWGGEK